MADQRGDNIPRDEMVKMLIEVGEPAPVPQKKSAPTVAGEGGFRCQRPGCPSGTHAHPLAKPPMNDELGKKIQAQVWPIAGITGCGMLASR